MVQDWPCAIVAAQLLVCEKFADGAIAMEVMLDEQAPELVDSVSDPQAAGVP
jgi:hypothetical protein